MLKHNLRDRVFEPINPVALYVKSFEEAPEGAPVEMDGAY